MGGKLLEELELREIVARNRELETQLTKRNEQYIFDLKKSLTAANLSEELQAIALDKILPELVAGQKSGSTARQLFGTVSERTEAILTAPIPKKEASKLLMWLDNVLMLFALLTIVAGIVPLLFKGAKSASEQQGILTLIIASLSGGYAFYLIYDKIYRFDRPGADQSKRPGTLKSMGMMMGIILIWMLFFMGSALIPKSINIPLDPLVTVILGAVAFGVRHLLKKKYNIEGSMFSR